MSDNDYFEGAGSQGTGEFSLCTRRINSLSRRDCGIVFGSLAAFSLMVAVVFAALGAWLILPFAGLEAMALYLAFSWVMRHAQDTEQLVIRGDVVMLAVREAAQTQRYEFNRVWARLVVDQRARNMRLALRSHGREIEVGRYLDGGGRQRLAQELKSRLNVR
ncbi:MAG TPA: DUF2244 domain-containing protein [Burkholderiales bacterium]|nr:DUF2244 domain-containing protein [Burkholderiales bacterium]